jgi:hypothetical protein
MSHFPFQKAKDRLYQNGGIDSREVELEVAVYERVGKTPGLYLAYYDGGAAVVESFADSVETQNRISELRDKFPVVVVATK